jgi:hypothetical protein
LIPVSKRDAREMIEELQSYGTLANPRSGTVDLACIEDFLMQVSRLIEKHVGIQEMDLNPVFAAFSDIEVCDARIGIG